MDGIDIKKWIKAAQRIVSQASHQFMQLHAVRHLRFIGYLRQELGIKNYEKLELELETGDGKKRRKIFVEITYDKPSWMRFFSGSFLLLGQHLF